MLLGDILKMFKGEVRKHSTEGHTERYLPPFQVYVRKEN
jgi:hypothetical protein